MWAVIEKTSLHRGGRGGRQGWQSLGAALKHYVSLGSLQTITQTPSWGMPVSLFIHLFLLFQDKPATASLCATRQPYPAPVFFPPSLHRNRCHRQCGRKAEEMQKKINEKVGEEETAICKGGGCSQQIIQKLSYAHLPIIEVYVDKYYGSPSCFGSSVCPAGHVHPQTIKMEEEQVDDDAPPEQIKHHWHKGGGSDIRRGGALPKGVEQTQLTRL